MEFHTTSGAYRLLISPETVLVKQASEYERNRNIAQVSLTIISTAFLKPMVQTLPADFTLEFGAPATWRANFKVFGEDDTDVAEEYTPPPFKKTKSASTTPTLTPIGLFGARGTTTALDPPQNAVSAGPSAAAPAELNPPPEPDHIVAAAVHLKENVGKPKPPRKGAAAK